MTTALLRALGKQLRLPETPHDPHRQLRHAAIFPLFLSACQELLDPADADRVAVAHAAEHACTRACLHDERRPRPAMIAGRLATLVGACRDPNEMLARLRGAQSALFLAGWLAAFDTGALVAAHATAHASPLDAAAIGLLRGYTSTQRAALGAIVLATRAPAEMIARMIVADIHRRTGSIRLGNRQEALPVAAKRIARAHRLTRARNGATSDRPLFTATPPTGR